MYDDIIRKFYFKVFNLLNRNVCEKFNFIISNYLNFYFIKQYYNILHKD